MDEALRLALVFSASLHLTGAAVLSESAKSSQIEGPEAINAAELAEHLLFPNSRINVISPVPDLRRLPTVGTRPPLDILFVQQRLYEAPTALNFAVVTPFDPDNREAGVELRCNSQAVASTTWTLHQKSSSVREFRWKLTDENCLYELVAILMRTTDYLYLYQMVPTRAWLAHKTPSRQFGRGSRF